MTAAELVPNALVTATGENSTAVSGDDDWLKVLSIANLLIDSWANETDWNSLYAKVQIGTVSATDTFDLDDSIRRISDEEGDFIRIWRTDGNYSDYNLVAPKRLKYYDQGNYVAQNGRQIVFNQAFTADSPEYGGTIEVPSYLYADHLVNDADEVPVDDPNWLVMAVAAEWVRTDLTLAQNYPLILAKANELMTAMKDANSPQLNTIPKSSVGRSTVW